jgi:hypothetical protein
MHVTEKGKMTAHWIIKKFNPRDGVSSEELCTRYHDGDLSCAPDEIQEIPFNRLLSEGITAILNLIAGNAATNFGNANAFLGVGDGVLSALAGTSAITNGSAVVTGTGTSYTTEVDATGFVRYDADDLIAEVLSVDSDTQITLVAAYAGSGGAAAAASVMAPVAQANTGLVGANTAYVAVEATYPQIAAATITWRAVFDGAAANFHWREFTVANGNSNAADNMNRKIQEAGVKAPGTTWNLELQITLS